MARPRRDRPLSELEGCVLGHLWKHGPSTPYAVRRMFAVSPSSHWSGSAGAVYPALERLEEQGLVKSKRAARGGREARKYDLTSTGRRRFRAWLEPPFAPDLLSVPPDPLRTRLSFLAVLPPARQRKFVAASIAGLRQNMKARLAAAKGDTDDRDAHSAATHAMRARVEWFERLRSELGSSSRGRRGGDLPFRERT